MAVAGVLCVEVGSFEGVVDFFFVFFRDVEYEGSEACVAISALLPGGCASDGDYDACAGFADFYG